MSLRVVLIGAGQVGGAVIAALRDIPDLDLRRVVVRRPDADRSHHGVPLELFTTDGMEAVHASDVDVVVDASSAPEATYPLAAATLRRGRLFATASKELAVAYGLELEYLATRHGGRFRYDASVCAALPTTRVIQAHCKGDRIDAIDGVLSGTCNFLLSTMEADRIPMAEALTQAQGLGIAEPDPSSDVDASDAARKTTLLARLAFGHIDVEHVRRQGLDGIDLPQVERLARRGRSLRLVTRIRQTASGIDAEVRPRVLSAAHPLAAGRGADSVVRVHSRNMGTIAVRGSGAGPLPTAAALISDALDGLRALS